MRFQGFRDKMNLTNCKRVCTSLSGAAPLNNDTQVSERGSEINLDLEKVR